MINDPRRADTIIQMAIKSISGVQQSNRAKLSRGKFHARTTLNPLENGKHTERKFAASAPGRLYTSISGN
jgi:hypothetical protein